MAYGKIDFEHVWKFQIGCMMSSQFPRLLDALHNNCADDVIVACLRLGWNDAFKHVSENTQKFNNLSDTDKNSAIIKACEALVDYFKTYAKQITTQDRFNNICAFLKTPHFVSIFAPIKDVKSSKYPLCLGHIQKLFNITMKLLLCLIISTEHAVACGINVKLGEVDNSPVYLNPQGHAPLLSYNNFNFSFDTADCPIDHIILKSVEANKTPSHSKIYNHKRYDEIVWSKMGDPLDGAKEDQQNYIAAQEEIGNIQSDPQKSNLCFDFEYWK